MEIALFEARQDAQGQHAGIFILYLPSLVDVPIDHIDRILAALSIFNNTVSIRF